MATSVCEPHGDRYNVPLQQESRWRRMIWWDNQDESKNLVFLSGQYGEKLDDETYPLPNRLLVLLAPSLESLKALCESHNISTTRIPAHFSIVPHSKENTISSENQDNVPSKLDSRIYSLYSNSSEPIMLIPHLELSISQNANEEKTSCDLLSLNENEKITIGTYCRTNEWPIYHCNKSIWKRLAKLSQDFFEMKSKIADKIHKITGKANDSSIRIDFGGEYYEVLKCLYDIVFLLKVNPSSILPLDSPFAFGAVGDNSFLRMTLEFNKDVIFQEKFEELGTISNVSLAKFNVKLVQYYNPVSQRHSTKQNSTTTQIDSTVVNQALDSSTFRTTEKKEIFSIDSAVLCSVLDLLSQPDVMKSPKPMQLENLHAFAQTFVSTAGLFHLAKNDYKINSKYCGLEHLLYCILEAIREIHIKSYDANTVNSFRNRLFNALAAFGHLSLLLSTADENIDQKTHTAPTWVANFENILTDIAQSIIRVLFVDGSDLCNDIQTSEIFIACKRFGALVYFLIVRVLSKNVTFPFLQELRAHYVTSCNFSEDKLNRIKSISSLTSMFIDAVSLDFAHCVGSSPNTMLIAVKRATIDSGICEDSSKSEYLAKAVLSHLHSLCMDDVGKMWEDGYLLVEEVCKLLEKATRDLDVKRFLSVERDDHENTGEAPPPRSYRRPMLGRHIGRIAAYSASQALTLHWMLSSGQKVSTSKLSPSFSGSGSAIKEKKRVDVKCQSGGYSSADKGSNFRESQAGLSDCRLGLQEIALLWGKIVSISLNPARKDSISLKKGNDITVKFISLLGESSVDPGCISALQTLSEMLPSNDKYVSSLIDAYMERWMKEQSNALQDLLKSARDRFNSDDSMARFRKYLTNACIKLQALINVIEKFLAFKSSTFYSILDILRERRQQLGLLIVRIYVCVNVTLNFLIRESRFDYHQVRCQLKLTQMKIIKGLTTIFPRPHMNNDVGNLAVGKLMAEEGLAFLRIILHAPPNSKTFARMRLVSEQFFDERNIYQTDELKTLSKLDLLCEHRDHFSATIDESLCILLSEPDSLSLKSFIDLLSEVAKNNILTDGQKSSDLQKEFSQVIFCFYNHVASSLVDVEVYMDIHERTGYPKSMHNVNSTKNTHQEIMFSGVSDLNMDGTKDTGYLNRRTEDQARFVKKTIRYLPPLAIIWNKITYPLFGGINTDTSQTKPAPLQGVCTLILATFISKLIRRTRLTTSSIPELCVHEPKTDQVNENQKHISPALFQQENIFPKESEAEMELCGVLSQHPSYSVPGVAFGPKIVRSYLRSPLSTHYDFEQTQQAKKTSFFKSIGESRDLETDSGESVHEIESASGFGIFSSEAIAEGIALERAHESPCSHSSFNPYQFVKPSHTSITCARRSHDDTQGTSSTPLSEFFHQDDQRQSSLKNQSDESFDSEYVTTDMPFTRNRELVQNPCSSNLIVNTQMKTGNAEAETRLSQNGFQPSPSGSNHSQNCNECIQSKHSTASELQSCFVDECDNIDRIVVSVSQNASYLNPICYAPNCLCNKAQNKETFENPMNEDHCIMLANSTFSFLQKAAKSSSAPLLCLPQRVVATLCQLLTQALMSLHTLQANLLVKKDNEIEKLKTNQLVPLVRFTFDIIFSLKVTSLKVTSQLTYLLFGQPFEAQWIDTLSSSCGENYFDPTSWLLLNIRCRDNDSAVFTSPLTDAMAGSIVVSEALKEGTVFQRAVYLESLFQAVASIQTASLSPIPRRGTVIPNSAISGSLSSQNALDSNFALSQSDVQTRSVTSTTDKSNALKSAASISKISFGFASPSDEPVSTYRKKELEDVTQKLDFPETPIADNERRPVRISKSLRSTTRARSLLAQIGLSNADPKESCSNKLSTFPEGKDEADRQRKEKENCHSQSSLDVSNSELLLQTEIQNENPGTQSQRVKSALSSLGLGHITNSSRKKPLSPIIAHANRTDKPLPTPQESLPAFIQRLTTLQKHMLLDKAILLAKKQGIALGDDKEETRVDKSRREAVKSKNSQYKGLVRSLTQRGRRLHTSLQALLNSAKEQNETLLESSEMTEIPQSNESQSAEELVKKLWTLIKATPTRSFEQNEAKDGLGELKESTKIKSEAKLDKSVSATPGRSISRNPVRSKVTQPHRMRLEVATQPVKGDQDGSFNLSRKEYAFHNSSGALDSGGRLENSNDGLSDEDWLRDGWGSDDGTSLASARKYNLGLDLTRVVVPDLQTTENEAIDQPIEFDVEDKTFPEGDGSRRTIDVYKPNSGRLRRPDPAGERFRELLLAEMSKNQDFSGRSNTESSNDEDETEQVAKEFALRWSDAMRQEQAHQQLNGEVSMGVSDLETRIHRIRSASAKLKIHSSESSLPDQLKENSAISGTTDYDAQQFEQSLLQGMVQVIEAVGLVVSSPAIQRNKRSRSPLPPPKRPPRPPTPPSSLNNSFYNAKHSSGHNTKSQVKIIMHHSKEMPVFDAIRKEKLLYVNGDFQSQMNEYMSILFQRQVSREKFMSECTSSNNSTLEMRSKEGEDLRESLPIVEQSTQCPSIWSRCIQFCLRSALCPSGSRIASPYTSKLPRSVLADRLEAFFAENSALSSEISTLRRILHPFTQEEEMQGARYSRNSLTAWKRARLGARARNQKVEHFQLSEPDAIALGVPKASLKEQKAVALLIDIATRLRSGETIDNTENSDSDVEEGDTKRRNEREEIIAAKDLLVQRLNLCYKQRLRAQVGISSIRTRLSDCIDLLQVLQIHLSTQIPWPELKLECLHLSDYFYGLNSNAQLVVDAEMEVSKGGDDTPSLRLLKLLSISELMPGFSSSASPNKKLEHGKCLGYGRFGIVYSVPNTFLSNDSLGTSLAIKCVTIPGHNADESPLSTVFSELSIMTRLTSAGINDICRLVASGSVSSSCLTRYLNGSGSAISSSALTSVSVSNLPHSPNIHVQSSPSNLRTTSPILISTPSHSNFNQKASSNAVYKLRDACAVIMTESYETNLSMWRSKQPKLITKEGNQGSERCNICGANFDPESRPTMKDALLYLSLFRRIVLACESMRQVGVHHMDLKCDNVLVSPPKSFTPLVSGACIADILKWCQHETSRFHVALCDFGESICNPWLNSPFFPNNVEVSPIYTCVIRGTENMQSPETLNLHTSSQLGAKASLSQSSQNESVRSLHSGVDSEKCDVWALGCLLFELLTNNILFDNKIDIPLFVAVSSPSLPVINSDSCSLLGHNETFLNLLYSILIRDPFRRPTFKKVLNLIDETINVFTRL